MTAQLLATELANLVQESKRKHNDLRQAAEKSLEEVKSLRGPSEVQIAAELAQRVNFVNPFIIACGTKNAKFTSIAIVCLQRLIVAKALPRDKLSPVLEALREATSAGLDVQLKILQALPSLLQNYASDVKGDLLVTALNICFILQSSKNAVVNNTSAATLQQLVVSVFDKVVAEDKSGSDDPTIGEAPVKEGTVPLKAAALDAYCVFNDLCLSTEAQRPEYLRFSGLSQTFGLELIESVLTNHASVFSTHPEQAHVLRIRVMPHIIRSLAGKPNFATGVRLVRILYTILRRHISILPTECGDALEILTHLLDQDTAVWKRSLCMEVFRGIFAEASLLRRIYMLYDAKEGEKGILKQLTATFVRVSTEKPVVIGLGHQSTIPVANPYANIATSTDQAMLEASGVTGLIGGTVRGEGHDTGISSQWSSVRVPCIDQLDKTDPPAIPESYVYSLTLACITSLSEGLAKFILPLTVPGDRSRKRSGRQDTGRETPAPTREESVGTPVARVGLERSASFKKNPVSVNPLTLEDHPLLAEIQVCAAIIDECWPAILATCSTFLYAALDSEYYHGLVRAFQKFAHVAGLLQLSTPRDAFLTTLGKAAVPPNVFTACLNAGSRPAATPTAVPETPNTMMSNARGLLSVDSLVSPSSEKTKQSSFDAGAPQLNTRNLLCLRALLNLGIALGPTLGSSWSIVLETLQQADYVLFSTGKAAGRTPTAAKSQDRNADAEANTLLANFNTEIKAVETAASRLFESTVDFPNSAFVEVVDAVCNLLEKRSDAAVSPAESPADSRPQSPTSGKAPGTPNNLRAPSGHGHLRVLSISTATSAGPNQEDQFALAKLGDVASLNLERLLSYPPEVSGWTSLVSELIGTLSTTTATSPVRMRAAEILVRLVLEAANATATQREDVRGKIQLRLLEALRDAVQPLQMEHRAISVANHATDVDIHRTILGGLKSILEHCGETLVSGWDVAFEIIDSIFVRRDASAVDSQERHSLQHPSIITRSVKLIKPSFGSLQLICSDFLASLPNSCFLHLVDTLYKFCSQDDDLNIALTTVTFFWVISDFLSGKSRSMSITEDVVWGAADKELTILAADSEHPSSGAALWLLLLLRLTTVTTDQRMELRNSAIQTLLRILNAYGNSLSPEAWSICIKFVIFRLLSSIKERLQSVHKPDPKDDSTKDWNETAVVIVNGVSDLLASYLDVLTDSHVFSPIWQDLFSHFAAMLDLGVLDISRSVFSSIGGILSKCEDSPKPSFDKTTLDQVWSIWSHGIPVPQESKEDKDGDSQKCLLAWVESFLELYRLVHRDLDVARVSRMLVLLWDAMQQASPAQYSSDIEYATPLQGRILEVVKTVRTDIPGVPAAMVNQIAEFTSMAFDQERLHGGVPQKGTYVAMSKEGMSIMQHLILKEAGDKDIYATGAFTAAISALARPIQLKYQFPITTKSNQPWREAVTSTLSILQATLPHLKSVEIPRQTFQEIWEAIVIVANGILSADCGAASPSVSITDDQDFDIASFHRLRELIIPSLGEEAIPDKTRKAYVEGLFRTSVIHAPAPGEVAMIYGGDGRSNADSLARGLSDLYKPRNGRTVDPPPTRREKMSYVCLDELFSLVSVHDETSAPTPTIQVQPPTPAAPKKMMHGPAPTSSSANNADRAGSDADEADAHALHVRLSRTAAPFLILRCALSLRAYIADQPLRGRMPQPLSQRHELGRILRSLVDLRSEPDAIPDTVNVDSERRKHLLRLYPLLVGTVRVAGSAGDEKIMGLLGEALDVVGGELGV